MGHQLSFPEKIEHALGNIDQDAVLAPLRDEVTVIHLKLLADIDEIVRIDPILPRQQPSIDSEARADSKQRISRPDRIVEHAADDLRRRRDGESEQQD